MCNERKKLCLRSVFIVSSEYSFLSTFLIVCWGLVRLVTVAVARVFSCVYFHQLLAPNPLQTITVIQRKYVVTRKRWRIWKESYLHFLLQMISPNISWSIVLELWTTLYKIVKNAGFGNINWKQFKFFAAIWLPWFHISESTVRMSYAFR
jgi:hypothetical protein